MIFRLRGRNPTTDLLHKRKKIANPPVIGDLAVLDTHDIHSLEVDPSVSRSDSKKGPLMRAVVRFVRCYSIVIGKLPVDLRTKVRECGTKIHVELSHTRLVRSCVRLRCVIDEIVGKEFVENLEVTLALDLFGISAYNRFRCVRWSDAVHFASLPLINRFTDRVEEAFQVSAQHIALNDKTSELAFSNDFDQTRRFQLFGVMGECGWADSVRLVQDSEWRRASTH